MAEVEDLYRRILFKLTDPLPSPVAGPFVIAGIVGFDYATWVLRRVLP